MEVTITTYSELEKYFKLFRCGEGVEKINLLVVTSPAGTQKTTLAKKIIKDNAITISTHTTPFGVYRQLYLHRNEDLILDDVDHRAADFSFTSRSGSRRVFAESRTVANA
jgi:DNA transposition AAA+ family ATPase